MAASVEEQRETVRVAGLWTARDRISLSGLVAGLIPFALAFAVYLLVFLEMRPLDATGDEPHYLITAESIAYDLDVDLRNDYASSERVLRVVNVFPLGPHAAVYKESGELRPFRGVGLPALLAPGVGLGGLTGARLVMVLIAALLADQLYRLLRDLRLRRRYRVLAWVAVVFCLPVARLHQPDLPRASRRACWSSSRYESWSRRVEARCPRAGVSGCRCAPLAPRALPPAVARDPAWAGRCRLPAGWRPRCVERGLTAAFVRPRVRFVVAVRRSRSGRSGEPSRCPSSLPYAIGLGLLAAAFQHWYGSPDPPVGVQGVRKPNASSLVPEAGTSGTSSPLRDILDPIVGWIPFAPVHWLGFAALGCLVLRFGWPAAACVAAPPATCCFVTSVGAGVGWGLPGAVSDDRHSAHRHSASGRDSEGSCGSCHLRAALGRLARLRRGRRARLRDGSTRSTGHSTSSECGAPPPHSRSLPSLSPRSRSLWRQAVRRHPRRGSWNGARSSEGPVETSPGSSGTGRTPR